jgi:DNA-binding CsgD family transcriptional regulator
MKQVAPHVAFPSGSSWTVGVLALEPAELQERFDLVFESGMGDLGEYRLAALETPTVGQLWLFRYEGAPFRGTEVLVDEQVPRDEALFAVWSELGIDLRGFNWINQYREYPGSGETEEASAEMVSRRVSGLAELTQRERVVLELLSEGSSVAEIGSRLGVSERTVRSRLQLISAKLGLGNLRHLREAVSRLPRTA